MFDVCGRGLRKRLIGALEFEETAGRRAEASTVYSRSLNGAAEVWVCETYRWDVSLRLAIIVLRGALQTKIFQCGRRERPIWRVTC